MKKYILCNKVQLAVVMFLRMINIGLMLCFSFIIRDLINSVREDVDINGLIRYGYYCVIYSILLFVFYVLADIMRTKYYNKCVNLLKNDYFDAVLGNSYENITKKESSYYISVLINDATMISQNYINAVFLIAEQIITIIGAFVAVLLIDKLLAIIMLMVTVFVSVFPIAFKNLISKTNLHVSEALSEYTSAVKDVLGGIDTVKTYNSEQVMSEKVKAYNKNVMKKTIGRDFISTILTALTSTTANIIKLGLIILSAYFVIIKRLDIGSVTAVLTLVGYFFTPVMNLTRQIGGILGSKGLIKKFLYIINEGTYQENRNVTNGEIVLQNVSYKYNDDRVILDKLNFVFKKGKKYLLIGESGSGKSTLLKLLNKMYSNYSGKISLGDIDYNDLNESTIHTLVTYSQQKTYLFNTSIKYNIDINHSDDEEKLFRCIKECNIERLISNFPNGIYSNVNEEIDKISEGEKERICLARVLYKDSEVLLLDEITASLDSINALEIEEMILNIKNKTIINVCHKFSDDIISRYDGIIVLENGSIVAAGPYNEVKNQLVFQKYRKVS